MLLHGALHYPLAHSRHIIISQRWQHFSLVTNKNCTFHCGKSDSPHFSTFLSQQNAVPCIPTIPYSIHDLRYCSIRDFKLSCNIVSFTAWNIKVMFSVSMAVVKWWKSGFVLSRLRSSKSPNMKFCTSCKQWGSPWKSLKVSLILTYLTFSANKSVLLRKSIMDTFQNVLLLIIVSNMSHDSKSLFVLRSSINTWSNSLDDARNRMDVMPSKHWNHFCLCERWPPTSTNKKGIPLMSKLCSIIPLVAFLACSMSSFTGT